MIEWLNIIHHNIIGGDDKDEDITRKIKLISCNAPRFLHAWKYISHNDLLN